MTSMLSMTKSPEVGVRDHGQFPELLQDINVQF